MLLLTQLEEIERYLANIPELVDAFESHDFNFQQHAWEWLRDLEPLLAQYIPYLTTEVSLLRAEIALAESGVDESKDQSKRFLGSRRKQRKAKTLDVLRRAGLLVEDSISGTRDLLAEGEKVARQIMSIAKAKRILPTELRDWETAAATWKQIEVDSDLMPVTIHLVGIVGRMNAIFLILKAGNEV